MDVLWQRKAAPCTPEPTQRVDPANGVILYVFYTFSRSSSHKGIHTHGATQRGLTQYWLTASRHSNKASLSLYISSCSCSPSSLQLLIEWKEFNLAVASITSPLHPAEHLLPCLPALAHSLRWNSERVRHLGRNHDLVAVAVGVRVGVPHLSGGAAASEVAGAPWFAADAAALDLRMDQRRNEEDAQPAVAQERQSEAAQTGGEVAKQSFERHKEDRLEPVVSRVS